MNESDIFMRAFRAEHETLDVVRTLEVIKRETHEMSVISGKLIPLGELRGDSDPNLWTGASSLEARLKSGDVNEAQLDEAMAIANESYVPVKPAAPKRCVEDRSEKNYDDNNPLDYDQGLGPQVQGGTADEAVARRITHNPEAESSIGADVEDVAQNKQSRFSPGAHTSTKAADGKTDCGSIDHEEPKLRLIVNSEAGSVIKNLVSPIMELKNQKLADSTFEDMQDGTRKLLSHAAHYFADLPKVLDVIREVNPSGVKMVTGEHEQIALIINMVKNETFHTNHYNVRSGGHLTVHNLDAWNIFEENSEPEQVALLSQAVATLMRITDGSIRLYVRKPAA